MSQLTLRPGLRRLWRDPLAVQFGIDPATAVVVDLPDPDAVRVLDLLDGSRTELAVLRDATLLGVPPTTTTELLGMLRRGGVLTSAEAIAPAGLPERHRRVLAVEAAALAGPPDADRPDGAEVLRRRAATTVSVQGTPRLAVPIGTALAASGIGHVDLQVHGRARPTDSFPGGLSWSDADRPRGIAAADALRRASAGTDTRAARSGSATFVVQVDAGAPAQLAAHAYARRRIPHLVVEERDASVVVGPLVPPRGSPCVNCLDLHRTDRDPAWPALVAQLATSPDAIGTTATWVAMIAVGVACGQVLAYVDGTPDPRTHAGSVEISAELDLRQRSWTRHPRCHCGVRPGDRGPTGRRPVPGAGPNEVQ